MLKLAESNLAVLEKSRITEDKVESYVIEQLNKSQGVSNHVSNQLRKVVGEFNWFYRTHKDIARYHSKDTLSDRVRIFLEHSPSMIDIEFNTIKQRELLEQWTGKKYSGIKQRDLAYKVFYDLVYKSFRKLCDENKIKMENKRIVSIAK